MSRSFGVDENNDIFIAPDGRLSVVVDLQSILETCAHAVKAQLGEMVLAVDQGVPNFQTIWNGAPNVVQFESYVRRALLSVDGVLEVTELDTDATTSVLKYTATIRTTFGEGTING
jgi:hypothetical protein